LTFRLIGAPGPGLEKGASGSRPGSGAASCGRIEASAKVWLEPVALASNVGCSAHELGVILRLVREQQPALPEAWHEFFGTG
jgi:hypothetical protein